MDAGMVKRIVFQLVPAQQRGDPFFVPAFLQTYHRFATTHQVLDLLFQRALCSLLETWLQRYPGHFYEANDLSCLKKLASYAWTQMPYSDLEFQTLELLTQLINEEEYKELAAELESKAEPEAAARQPELQEPSLPQAVHPPAIEVLQPPKGPTTDPDCEPNKAQEHPAHVLCVPNWSTASHLGILEAGTVQKHMNLLLPAQQAGTHHILCLLFPR
ncbi:ral guanine nucleotide dissociation stimulator-like [Ochotona princeps]|uniref:ral guanine nucleotide dissociation stimulator-like n=1 Tax=Ochotona princeps TaxID=9978 RepID=UPI002715415A|nr:ral guanine nucleotide dissociation stimulator-like [Ochotona princeps]